MVSAPLLLYYAFLNLLRACTAFRSQQIPTTRMHGLAYEQQPDVLENAAKVTTKGAFADFLAAQGHPVDESQSHCTWRWTLPTSTSARIGPAGSNHAALFILGSIVRYEPQVLLDTIRPESELGVFETRTSRESRLP